MCYGCYEEFGKPKPDSAALAVVPLIAKVYDDNFVGGGLHIVVDDWNVFDECIEYCMKENDLTADEMQCAEAMLALSEDQRAAALGEYEGFTAD
jgi:hypothetical protein